MTQPVISSSEAAQLAAAHPQLNCRRSLVDAHYASAGRDLIRDDFPWCASHPTVLAQIGRMALADSAGAVELADELEERRPAVKTAIAMLRRARNGGSQPKDKRQLARELAYTVQRFLGRHPHTTGREVQAALSAAARAVERAMPQ